MRHARSASGDLTTIAEQREIWEKKPAIRTIYEDYHRRLLSEASGVVLEIGAGSGNLRKTGPIHGVDLVSIDILPESTTDVIADAHMLPFARASFDRIVMLDVLHHLQNPIVFLREAARVIVDGGEIAMIEPGISPVSRIFYTLFHQEPVRMDADPFEEREPDPHWRAFDANQAIPTLMFERVEADASFAKLGLPFKVTDKRWLALWAYPLSGGFRRWQLIPGSLVKTALRLEERFLPVLGRFAGFRLYVRLEKI